ncbi:type II and III secretion system protein [Marinomonas epiphytica]
MKQLFRNLICMAGVSCPFVWSMDVHFEGRSVQEVLPWLAAQMGENLVLSSQVQTQLSISLQDASWQEIMAVVGMQPDIDLVWRDGVAVLMPKHKKENVPVCRRSLWVLKHAKSEDVSKHIQTLYPKYSIVTDARTNSIIIHSCESQAGIKETLTWLDKPLRQIEIRAHITQISTSAQSQFGVDWQARLSKGISSNLGGAVELGALLPSSSLSFASAGGSGLLSFALDMMETEGMAKVVSEPKIVASEGQAAYIESGTEVPYQTVNDDNVHVEFRQAALKLEVTPRVKEGGRISLTLVIHQDSVGELVNGVPSLKTNRLKTQVVVNDQQTLVLGGIFREETLQSEARVPWLSSLPLLGGLFKRQIEQQEKVELLVFITPKLLQMTVN